jgi:superfamily I DNA and RNA helicase
MFAHGMGMGLFESIKLRWLEEKEWRDCGYNVTITNGKYYLKREPLRRFEDLDENFESIEIVEINGKYSDTIVQILEQIKHENATVLPEDIGIIFLDLDSEIYKLADILEIKIPQKLGWLVNKAYETKKRLPETILISNRNNVKGLEFPFVICVTKGITSGSRYRNSLYTMLTRSFIKSFLVIPNNRSGLTENMKLALQEIIKNKQMVIKEPTETEKKKIRMRFEYRLKKLSHYDLMMEIFKSLKVDNKYHDKLLKATEQFGLINRDEKDLVEFVKSNLKFITTDEGNR